MFASANAAVFAPSSRRRIDLYVVDLTPDGTIPQRSDDSFGVLDRVLPELPKNETELQEGWEFTGVDVHHRCRAAPTTEAGRFTFLIEQSSHMMTLNGFAATFTYDLDRDRGVITAIRASHRVRGREARTTDEQLIELGQLDAETLARLSGDVDVAVEAERHYQAKINAALTGDAPAEGPARLAEALQELTEARQLLSSDLFRDYVDRIIRTHHASEASYAQRLRAQERVIGQPAPAWTFDDLEGTAHRLSDYRGQVVVLDFWYRACGWCIRSMPQVQAVARRFADRPVAVLGMNVDRNVSDARAVVEQLGITTTTIRADQSIAQAYGVRGYPTLFVVDQSGNMRLVHVGYSTTLEEELAQLIERLLDG